MSQNTPARPRPSSSPRRWRGRLLAVALGAALLVGGTFATVAPASSTDATAPTACPPGLEKRLQSAGDRFAEACAPGSETAYNSDPALEGHPYTVVDETPKGFTVHLDVVDARWWGLLQREGLTTTWRWVVRVRDNGGTPRP